MAMLYPHAFFNDSIIAIDDARISIASSAVLYGLSVYTVLPIIKTRHGMAGFCLFDHYHRLVNSAKIIGIDGFGDDWNFQKFEDIVKTLVRENNITERTFIRASIHVSALVSGTRSRGLETIISMFAYEASPIIPQDGARLKTSVWRRVPDYAIPSRAKVNGAYVNSVLGKQDALDSGYDDCLFLDDDGHVCELSAANIFMVRDGVLCTPHTSSDILEGINRKTIIKIAKDIGIPTIERDIDLTELYIADEIFASGTSAFVAPIVEIDARKIKNGDAGPITETLRSQYTLLMQGDLTAYNEMFTYI